MKPDSLLTIEDLHIEFPTDDGLVIAVDGLSLEVGRGQIVGLVGESGCGKTVTGYSILGLLQSPGRIKSGKLIYRPELEGKGINLSELSPKSEQIRRIRGKEISMIFQEPMSSLTPVYTIGCQIEEAIHTHEKVSRAEARKRAINLLRRVGIPGAESRVNDYPHQLSGGMRQRAMIAMALSCNPRLLIADEPTTALDVTVQAQIMDLLREQREHSDLSILIITHDMGIIADIADEVVVMYAGVAVESAPVETIFANPLHPYTRGLLASIPGTRHKQGERLTSIEGVVPDWRNRPSGCLFAPRCPERFEKCDERPPLTRIATDHAAACWKAVEQTEVVDAS
ncbi:MAG TPA: ABC transporter ATP-binding protein [Armatimonadota bacterium]|jgi:peptide/nickel transport system ATP-binding protein|nr:ABC transporter ATP-binding protein [Armatimonadota bacterium]HOP79814.1 ABC transporter ATP-binding protein [Armatimonadota bacterium]HPP75290.1 ABC transporter ATP-binding protein [Armatimonadota bacterium]